LRLRVEAGGRWRDEAGADRAYGMPRGDLCLEIAAGILRSVMTPVSDGK
jgi:hypothetical protein